MDEKFIDAARADYEALYKDRDMVQYLAELYVTLNELDPTNHNIDDHWSFSEDDE
jgi:hypothetical protein